VYTVAMKKQIRTTKKEMTVTELGGIVVSLETNVNELGSTVTVLVETVDELGTTVTDLVGGVDELGTAVSNLVITVTDLGELVLKLSDRLDSVESFLSNSINMLAMTTAKGFTEVHERIDILAEETNVNFRQVRHSILNGRDIFATKEEVGTHSFRVKTLEESK
jgi:methyl-accepting chemotaxis protein